MSRNDNKNGKLLLGLVVLGFFLTRKSNASTNKEAMNGTMNINIPQSGLFQQGMNLQELIEPVAGIPYGGSIFQLNPSPFFSSNNFTGNILIKGIDQEAIIITQKHEY